MPKVEGLISRELYTIGPLAGVARAAYIMEHYGIGCLPVIDDGKLVGIVTSRDIRRAHPNRLVADAMTRQVITISPTASLLEAQRLMVKHNVERLVVVQDEHVVGIITSSQVSAEMAKYTDSLTGLYKAEIFCEKALEILKNSQEIAVIFLDLDNFGFINKEYGHIFGDRVLIRTAAVLKNLMDVKKEALCRYAGDEFAAATCRSLTEAEKLAREMTSALAGENWPDKIEVTVSAGIAGGGCEELRRAHNDADYIIKYLVNLASLASSRAKTIKQPVVVARACATEFLPGA
ncbi:GGDEF domain-containing protein [Neomoorella humiferrea]|uniref:GGDEF domain-containing protein n=1 Tax=Neomoorella humiferrea TaxID=676965 RepID=UPI003D8F243F